MPVTDEQEAVLHAQLAGRLDEHRRLLAALDADAGRTGYTSLVAAAFSIAADRHFPKDVTPADVIEYVGDVRSRVDSAQKMDPRVAERILLTVLTGAKSEDIDAGTSFQAQILLLAALTADAHLDSDGLDRFMREARELADEWLAE